jgi:hypothetical protein
VTARTRDPWQWLHDNGFTWDDVNAAAAIFEAGGFDVVPEDGVKPAEADPLTIWPADPPPPGWRQRVRRWVVGRHER